ncbi:hypothetical protein [Pediococcus pentosaceus]|uniref:hypothetical protein n=1 Tax=Pediococcus pentosaceus TaxID=1255 RepID=UPI000C068A0E|nr:hypothetical protein [Pediococcus pentosaceus]
MISKRVELKKLLLQKQQFKRKHYVIDFDELPEELNGLVFEDHLILDKALNTLSTKKVIMI